MDSRAGPLPAHHILPQIPQYRIPDTVLKGWMTRAVLHTVSVCFRIKEKPAQKHPVSHIRHARAAENRRGARTKGTGKMPPSIALGNLGPQRKRCPACLFFA